MSKLIDHCLFLVYHTTISTKTFLNCKSLALSVYQHQRDDSLAWLLHKISIEGLGFCHDFNPERKDPSPTAELCNGPPPRGGANVPSGFTLSDGLSKTIFSMT